MVERPEVAGDGSPPGDECDLRTIAELHDRMGGTFSRHEIVKELLRDTYYRSLPCLAVAQVDIDITPKSGTRVEPDTVIRVVPCSHCNGAATRIWRTPDVPKQLLCTQCRRIPTPDSPIYPADYLTLPTGGFGLGVPWDVFGESVAARQRRESLDDVSKAELGRTCTDCGNDFMPVAPRQFRCRNCAVAQRGRR